ncbi:adenosine deaminase [Pseudactinotalea sp.]|uniref:adenosine deaminase n=1 Tax=Pseudactinotalea sp. TaxID=1926260 RepID=UPI003B3AAA6C
MTLTSDEIRALPKVVLHDHLDGGLRPATIIELAAEIGHELPTTDPDALAQWFVEACDSGSLVRYLETFAHTCAVMQTTEGLRRVAKESVLDLAADGVVYAEQRYAPEQHQERGLSLQEVVDAVEQGFADGVAEAAENGHTIRVGTLLSAMRQAERSAEIAELTIENLGVGVVGFDIAGPEDGFPPTLHTVAFDRLRGARVPVTIHAGEDAGFDSIDQAVIDCHALRIGHGVHIIGDVRTSEGADPADPDSAELGVVATWVRDRQIPLEVCPSSNIQTGTGASIADHPITRLRDLGFAVTINTDNRLMSGTSMSREMALLVAEAGWDLADLERATLTAAWNGFAHHDVLEDIITNQIIPGYAAHQQG